MKHRHEALVDEGPEKEKKFRLKHLRIHFGIVSSENDATISPWQSQEFPEGLQLFWEGEVDNFFITRRHVFPRPLKVQVFGQGQASAVLRSKFQVFSLVLYMFDKVAKVRLPQSI